MKECHWSLLWWLLYGMENCIAEVWYRLFIPSFIIWMQILALILVAKPDCSLVSCFCLKTSPILEVNSSWELWSIWGEQPINRYSPDWSFEWKTLKFVSHCTTVGLTPAWPWWSQFTNTQLDSFPSILFPQLDMLLPIDKWPSVSWISSKTKPLPWNFVACFRSSQAKWRCLTLRTCRILDEFT